jgi:hypothetical protein
LKAAAFVVVIMVGILVRKVFFKSSILAGLGYAGVPCDLHMSHVTCT